jgi:hypothetical protein
MGTTLDRSTLTKSWIWTSGTIDASAEQQVCDYHSEGGRGAGETLPARGVR